MRNRYVHLTEDASNKSNYQDAEDSDGAISFDNSIDESESRFPLLVSASVTEMFATCCDNRLAVHLG